MTGRPEEAAVRRVRQMRLLESLGDDHGDVLALMREVLSQGSVIEAAREEIRSKMLDAQPVATDGNETRADGYFSGLLTAIRVLDKALAAGESSGGMSSDA